MTAVTPGRCVVTGSAGYVGSRLVASLAGHVEGTTLTGLVRKRSAHLPDHLQVEADLLTDRDVLVEQLRGAAAVVHLAGHNEVVAAQEPDRALSETAVSARHVAEAARSVGVPRLVYVSTVHVYGTNIVDDAVLTEDLAPAPRSTYAIARLTCEHLLAQAGLDLVVLRLTNAVGAPVHPAVDRWTLVAADLCRQAALTGSLTLRTPGVQWRDFVDLGDVCRVIAACTDPAVVPPGVYNLGSGRVHTIRELATTVQDTFETLTGSRPVLHAPDPEGLLPRPYRVSVDALASHGLTLPTRLDASIDELARFCLDHQERL